MVKYYLVSSALAKVRGRVARVKSVAAAHLDDVIARMIWEHPGLQRADALRILNCYFEAVQGLLLDGRSVHTPLEHFRLSIRGTFVDTEDSFHAGRHALVPTVSPSRQLTVHIQQNAQLKKTAPVVLRPGIYTYLDLASGTTNSRLTPGGHGKVAGRDLKFDPADPQQGVFFTAGAGAEVRATNYLVLPSTILLRVPALTPGRYGLEVRAIPNKGRALRVGRLDYELTVE